MVVRNFQLQIFILANLLYCLCKYFLFKEIFFSLLEIIFNQIDLIRDGNEWKILRVRRRK